MFMAWQASITLFRWAIPAFRSLRLSLIRFRSGVRQVAPVRARPSPSRVRATAASFRGSTLRIGSSTESNPMPFRRSKIGGNLGPVQSSVHSSMFMPYFMGISFRRRLGRILLAELPGAHALVAPEAPVEIGDVVPSRGIAHLRDGAIGLDEEAAGRPDPELREVSDEGLSGALLEEAGERGDAHVGRRGGLGKHDRLA